MNQDQKSIEKEKWEQVKDHIGNERVTLGPYFSYQLMHTPRHILFTLSRYKFAAKLFGEGKYILEVGCSEGLGTVLLGEFAKRVVAIDIDTTAIDDAKKTFSSDKIEFKTTDILDTQIDQFDGIACFDVIEHIYKQNEDIFLKSLCSNLKDTGMCIIGTPNETSNIYANEATRMGHINLYTWDRLKKTMEVYFEHVILFSSNDEIIHTGFYPMAHYLIAVGINKR